MLRWLRSFFGRHVVAEVPEEMSACLSCRALQCSRERWATCPQRLAEAAALKALREAQEKPVKEEPVREEPAREEPVKEEPVSRS